MSDVALPLAVSPASSRRAARVRGEPVAVQAVLIAISLAFLTLFLLLPLVSVFVEAGARGWAA